MPLFLCIDDWRRCFSSMLVVSSGDWQYLSTILERKWSSSTTFTNFEPPSECLYELVVLRRLQSWLLLLLESPCEFRSKPKEDPGKGELQRPSWPRRPAFNQLQLVQCNCTRWCTQGSSPSAPGEIPPSSAARRRRWFREKNTSEEQSLLSFFFRLVLHPLVSQGFEASPKGSYIY